jgi:soluble lytic murein transglycosylase
MEPKKHTKAWAWQAGALAGIAAVSLGLVALLAPAGRPALTGLPVEAANAATPFTTGVLASPPLALPPPADMQRLREGVAAAGASQWQAVRTARAMAGDVLVQRILTWRLLSDRDAPAAFEELDAALTQLAAWPGRETMRRKAEQTIIDSGLSAAQRIAWLTQSGPITGDGKVYLAMAKAQTGDRAGATALIKDAWRDATLTPRAETLARQSFTDALNSADYAVRVDRALWREDRAGAQRYLGLLTADQRKLAEARIALQRPPRRGLQQIVERVPASLAGTPGLLHDRARYIRKSGRPDDALPVALQLARSDVPSYGREDTFTLLRTFVPAALRRGDGRLAYQLVSGRGLVSGEAFAEAEFLSGWLSLRYLRQPQQAMDHFAKLNAGVSTPVSRARALYWKAQAQRAMGQEAEAAASLAEAAKMNFTYYGQLAAARSIPNATLAFDEPAAPSGEQLAEFHGREIVRALRLVAEVGDQQDFEAIAFYLDDVMASPLEHEMLSQIARERAYIRTAVRSAKSGIRRGIVAPDSAFPVIPLPAAATSPGRPEPALTLAIIRQESEFDPRARSRADARGMMQLLPRTARQTAQREGMPYQAGWLMEDPAYNITLGSAYLGGLIDSWNGSYVLAIASYNAGPGRAREWIDDWGDPRRSGADVVDWVELIPFSETRNYVQRVLENVQVYRHRLSRAPAPIRLEQDLRRGGF